MVGRKSAWKRTLLLAATLSIPVGVAIINHYAEKRKTSHITTETYALVCDDNPQVYVLALEHPSSIGKLIDPKEKEAMEQKLKHALTTLSSLHEQGIEEIILEGATTETFENIRRDPRGFYAEGDQNYFMRNILKKLFEDNWRIEGSDDNNFQYERQRHQLALKEIWARYQRELSQRAAESDKKMETLNSLARTYSDLMIHDTRAYLEGPEGEAYYNLVYHWRNQSMHDKVIASVKRKKKVALLAGSGHGVAVDKRLEKEGIPRCLYTNKSPESLRELTRADFIQQSTPREFVFTAN